MSVVIKVLAVAATGEPVNQYLKTYDPEAHDGLGFATMTRNVLEAMRFPSTAAAMEEWRRVPVALPTRPDGRPNRPLTAFTVEVQPL